MHTMQEFTETSTYRGREEIGITHITKKRYTTGEIVYEVNFGSSLYEIGHGIFNFLNELLYNVVEYETTALNFVPKKIDKYSYRFYK